MGRQWSKRESVEIEVLSPNDLKQCSLKRDDAGFFIPIRSSNLPVTRMSFRRLHDSPARTPCRSESREAVGCLTMEPDQSMIRAESFRAATTDVTLQVVLRFCLRNTLIEIWVFPLSCELYAKRSRGAASVANQFCIGYSGCEALVGIWLTAKVPRTESSRSSGPRLRITTVSRKSLLSLH